jgi:uncharacterized protein YdiU (UPF0061 family)
MADLNSLSFDNAFVTGLPGDPQPDNHRRQVYHACYSKVQPSQVSRPELVAYSIEAAALLDLHEEDCNTELFRDVFVGNKLLREMDPYAMCYGGHQFGSWTGQLGDGRAINLGEIINRHGQRWIMQLKGAGPTPYSRQADGLAVLRSSIREFLCSEAMHHLGIPTTRALSIILTGEEVMRDMFYDGHPKTERGAVVCRLSPSFIRFGNFEIFSARNDLGLLKQLIDFTIVTDFPHLGPPSKEVYLQWFTEVCETTAKLIVDWMRVGFVHGVMNTDNMSILGLTIDYGPYGWIEGYDGNWTPNTTDAHSRRYSFGNQPHIAQWNLLQLANAIFPVVGDRKGLEAALAEYHRLFMAGWDQMIATKLGIKEFRKETDDQLAGDLIDLLQMVETDMTVFFRKLIEFSPDQDATINPLVFFEDAYYDRGELDSDYREKSAVWFRQYQQRLLQDNWDGEERRAQMRGTNPKFVLRNYLAQMAIDQAETGDFSLVRELLDCLRRPYDEQPQYNNFYAKRPEWARNRAGCSMLSCSS